MMDLDYPGRNTVPLLAFVINEVRSYNVVAGLLLILLYIYIFLFAD